MGSSHLLWAVRETLSIFENTEVSRTRVLRSILTRNRQSFTPNKKLSTTRWYTSPMLRRWFLFGLALMVLTLCLAAWGVSYWRDLTVTHNGQKLLSFRLNSGRVGILRGSTWGPALNWRFDNESAFKWDGIDESSRFRRLGFSYGADDRKSYITIPLWFLSLLSLFLLRFAWRKTRHNPAGKAFPIEPSIEAKSPSA